MFGKFVCFFPGTFKFIQGLACGNSHGYRPFFKNTIILFVVPPKFALALFSISLGAKGLLSTHSLASFVIDLSSFNQVGICFF